MKYQTIFIGIASVALLIAAGAYSFGQYVRVKEHNLEVLSQMRLCAGAEGLSDKGQAQCRTVAKQQGIPEEFYEKVGEGFDE